MTAMTLTNKDQTPESSQRGIKGAASVFASATMFERVDISAADHVVAINGGYGLVLNCDTAGSVIKVDTPDQIGVTPIALEFGINYISVKKIYKVGSAIVGNIDVLAW